MDAFAPKFLKEIARQLDAEREVCGSLVLDDQALLTSHDIRIGERVDGREQCITRYQTPVSFHTHPTHEKGYPSFEDLMKVVKPNRNTNKSYIFTAWGLWELTRRPGLAVNYNAKDFEIVERFITMIISQPLYKATQSGRVYTSENRPDVDRYIRQLECFLPMTIVFHQV